ncbi:hypothetical protein QBC34DRAFT_462297 [Podospora aff. communis PSN243]|uniref:Uncharacterized protein n=1 Tax=Podospora aff. communis PSN243 TaxID=3040156 RepID=A0AAV9GNJ7_9PEZI|nr:hypothetical protein QBC34DRAFT_462297 [Podospora aff. communis PSN243]
MSSGTKSDILPRWGDLPAEQYLLNNWDASAQEEASDQRRRLIRQFLALETIPYDPKFRVPTEEEVRTILEPWRPQRWRFAAAKIHRERYDNSIWLRTYDPEDEEIGNKKIVEWIAVDKNWDPNFQDWDLPWRILDDPAVFSFGDEWQRVFDVIPELATTDSGDRSFSPHSYPDELAEERLKLRECVAEQEGLEARIQAAQYSLPAIELQYHAVASFLVVVDKEAWEQNRFKLFWLDAHGNVVRESTVAPERVAEIRVHWSRQMFYDNEHWLGRGEEEAARNEDSYLPEPGSKLGDKYRATGKMGRLLYAVDDLLQ